MSGVSLTEGMELFVCSSPAAACRFLCDLAFPPSSEQLPSAGDEDFALVLVLLRLSHPAHCSQNHTGVFH